MEKTKDKIKEKTETKTKTAENTDKNTGFKPKPWAEKFLKEHQVLMDALKDR